MKRSIRSGIYSGEKFEAVQEVEAGRVCAVTGLENTRPGQDRSRRRVGFTGIRAGVDIPDPSSG